MMKETGTLSKKVFFNSDLIVVRDRAVWLESHGYASFVHMLRDRTGPCRIYWESIGDIASPDVAASGPDELLEIHGLVLNSLLKDLINQPRSTQDWPLLAKTVCSWLALPPMCNNNMTYTDILDLLQPGHWLVERLLVAFPGATHAALHMALLSVNLYADNIDLDEMTATSEKVFNFCQGECIEYAHATGWPLHKLRRVINDLTR